MKNRVIGLILVAVMILGSTIASCAATHYEGKTEIFTTPRMTVNGNFVTWTDAYPFIDKNNRTQVPLRASMEACGLKVTWNANARTAIVTDGRTTVSVPIGYKYIYVNGYRQSIDTAAMIVRDRTYLPIRAVAEAFGYGVLWNGSYNMDDNEAYYHRYTSPINSAYQCDGPLISLVGLPFNVKGYNYSDAWWVKEVRLHNNGYLECLSESQDSLNGYLKGCVKYGERMVFLTEFGAKLTVGVNKEQIPYCMYLDDNWVDLDDVQYFQ